MLLTPSRQDAPLDAPLAAMAEGARTSAPPNAHEQQARPGPGEQAVSALCRDLVAQGTLPDGVRVLTHGLQAQGGAAEVRLGWYERGHARLDAMAITASATAGARADAATAWTDAMEEALDQGQALSWPPAPGMAGEWVTLAQRRLAGEETASCLTLILPGAPEPLGALSLRWPAGLAAPGPEALPAWQALAAQVAPILAWQRHAGRAWHWHLRQAVSRAWSRGSRNLRTRPKRAALAAAVALAALALLPLPDRIGGPARIEGAQQRVLAATSDGFIKQVYAQPGDRVKAGQVLADLAEQDLKLEREKWNSQAAQQDNAYAAAMTRADRAEAALALSRLEEAQAQLALVDEQLQRTQLKAPFDGVLIQGDLSQSVGAPVKQGDTLMTVASTQRWRVIVEVDEADIGRVHAGQEGAIALSALPWDTLPLRVRRITPLAQAREGRNLFEVEAEFTAPVPADVRPGLTGQARLRIGHSPLLWSWLRPVVERARLGWWSLLGG